MQYEPAHDSSLIPIGEIVINPITISDDNDVTVTFPAASNPRQSPLILLVKSDGSFVEGDAAPDQSKSIERDANVIYSLPVSQRTAWHFKRASGAGTVTIRLKLYVG